MNRIMIIGVSAGVGKSTFARKLGEAIGINVYHLDSFYWKPNWVEAPKEEFVSAQKAIVKREKWIIEGNYTGTFPIRMDRADTIIYLELPLIMCLYRVAKRFFTHIGKTRADMGEGCKEKLDWAFIKFICTTYYNRKITMKERFQNLKETDPNKEIIILKSKQEIKAYIDRLTI
ncbi:topology modulation protein [Oceanobacillus piezotolerans]|uniref:Topology modulation protein n=1 Tax=Oceanobacillus piezotolerans TaxID=2448030 RepID=A0A498DAD2_9BACI|nr:topology modulation protein [Oceanobacillus piezotolerans]RLL48293.1 topology modulation protein [Oceanobacillus piezotolerans]